MNTLGEQQEWCKRPRKLQKKRIKWYGHVRRMKEEHTLRRMLDVDIPGKKEEGVQKCRRRFAPVFESVRIPFQQRSHVDYIQRNSVRPFTVVMRADRVVPRLACFKLNSCHLRLRRHRHEDVLCLSVRPWRLFQPTRIQR